VPDLGELDFKVGSAFVKYKHLISSPIPRQLVMLQASISEKNKATLYITLPVLFMPP
jgi:hypothetical protein